MTNPRWKTLSRKDPEFLAYLDGSFSRTHVALPLRSLNVGTSSEQVTFEIKPVDEIQKPSSFVVVWRLMRPSTLALSLGPMIATLMFCLAQGYEVHWPVAWFSILGVLYFHVALNLFNDYGDHIKGQDRLRVTGGSRAIQSGWVKARSVKRAAWFLLFLAAGLGLPVVFVHFQPVLLIAGLALFAALEFGFQKFRLKARGWAEIMAFLLTGPLLALGFGWAITAEVSWTEGLLGCIFGSIALMYFHSANFENIMSDKQSGVSTWATRTGFDASKNFFYFTAALALTFSAALVFVFEREMKLIPFFLAQVLFVIPVVVRVRTLASPLASALQGLRMEAVKLCWLTTAALASGYAWILATKVSG